MARTPFSFYGFYFDGIFHLSQNGISSFLKKVILRQGERCSFFQRQKEEKISCTGEKMMAAGARKLGSVLQTRTSL